MITLKKFAKDINGNSIVLFSIRNTRTNSSVTVNHKPISTDKNSYSYSLQTNGNLPKTHRFKIDGFKIQELSETQQAIIKDEILDFLLLHGSDKQKFLLSVSSK
jgi:hypothetical protein